MDANMTPQEAVSSAKDLSFSNLTYILAVVFFVVIVILILLYFKKKKLYLKLTKLSLAGNSADVVEEPVEKVQLISEPEFIYAIPVLLKNLQIKVEDKDGAGLSKRSVTISAKNNNQEEVLRGVLTTDTDSTGIAVFQGLSIVEGGTYKIIVTCGGKQCASEAFEIPDITSKVDRLFFTKQPESTNGRPASISEIIVFVSNTDGVGLVGRRVRISVPDKKDGTERLKGILEKTTDINGCASFSDLSICKTGFYRIVAICEATKVESAEFEVTPPGVDADFKGKEFDTKEYWESLCLSLYVNNTGDKITIDGEEL